MPCIIPQHCRCFSPTLLRSLSRGQHWPSGPTVCFPVLISIGCNHRVARMEMQYLNVLLDQYGIPVPRCMPLQDREIPIKIRHMKIVHFNCFFSQPRAVPNERPHRPGLPAPECSPSEMAAESKRLLGRCVVSFSESPIATIPVRSFPSLMLNQDYGTGPRHGIPKVTPANPGGRVQPGTGRTSEANF
jgi:hypothetical protein